MAEGSSAEDEPEPEVTPVDGKGSSSRMDAEPTLGCPSHRTSLGTAYEAFAEHGVELEYVETDEHVADIFTKGLAPCKWPNASSHQSDVVLQEVPCSRWSTTRVESSPTGASSSSAPNEEDPAASYPIEDLVPRCKVRVSFKRVYTYGPTPGCEGCRALLNQAVGTLPANHEWVPMRLIQKRHNEECKYRFANIVARENGDRQTR